MKRTFCLLSFALLASAVCRADIAGFATTQQPNGITTSAATLNGMATPNGFQSSAWFEWGALGVFDHTTTPVNVGSGFSVIQINSAIGGLAAGSAYNSRLVVSNSGGVVRGYPRQFVCGGVLAAWAGTSASSTNGANGLNNVAAIAAGGNNGIALRTDGSLVEWGTATDVPAGLSGVLGIAAGTSHFLALKSNGTVVAWGDHTFGESLGQTNVPPGLSNVIAVAAGVYHSLVLKRDGTVAAWGLDTVTNVPPGLSNVVMISTGNGYHCLALKNNGSVVGWGSSDATLTNAPANLTNGVDLAQGVYASLALKSDSKVVAWGSDPFNYFQTNVPPALTNVVGLAAGYYHVLALRQNGSVVAWGRNNAGQTNVPANLSNVIAVAAGGLYNLVLQAPPPPPLQIACPNDIFVNRWSDVPPPDPNSVQVLSGCTVVSKVLLQETRQTNGCETVILRAYAVADSCHQTNICTQEIDVDIPPEILGFTSTQTTKADGIHVTICVTVTGVGLGPLNWSVNTGNPISTSIFGNCFELVMDPLNEDDVSVNMTVSNNCGGDGGNSPPVTTCGICLSRGTPGLLTGTTGGGSSPPVATLNCGLLSTNALWYKVIATNGTGMVTVSTEGSSNNTLVAIYTGSIAAPVPVACNDDINGTNKQSRVHFTAQQGLVYWIVVDPRTNAPTGLRVGTGFEPKIVSYGRRPDGLFQLQSEVAPPIPYTLLMSTNPSTNASSWSAVLRTNVGTNFPYIYYLETNTLSSPRRFYRIGL